VIHLVNSEDPAPAKADPDQDSNSAIA